MRGPGQIWWDRHSEEFEAANNVNFGVKKHLKALKLMPIPDKNCQ